MTYSTYKRSIVTVTTDGSGAATAYSDVLTGKLMSINYIKDGSTPYADTVDFDLNIETTGEVVWDQDNITASVAVRPVAAVQTYLGANAVFASGGEPVRDRFMLVNDRVRIVLANGGDTKSGVFEFRVS